MRIRDWGLEELALIRASAFCSGAEESDREPAKEQQNADRRRAALGAQPRVIRAMVLYQGLRPVAIGVVAGLISALAAARLAVALLFGVTPGDPAALAGACVALVSVTLTASYIPARRAARVDPMVALRTE